MKMVVKGNPSDNEEERSRILPGTVEANARADDEIEAVEADISDQATGLSDNQDASQNEAAETQNFDEDRAGSRGSSSGSYSVRRGFEACLRRVGLCGCVVQECMGNQKTCRICEPRKMERYKKLEEEYFRAEFGEDIDDRYRDVMIIKFFLGSPDIKEVYPLLVTKAMTALNVIRGVSVHVNTSDFYRYSIVEFWREFEAERSVDDHELILELRHKHVRSKQNFLFVYQRDLEKYQYIKEKEHFFIHPETARRKNANKKQHGDPLFIQVLDSFFSKPNNPLEALPVDSSQDSTPEKSVVIQNDPDDTVLVQVETDGTIAQFSRSQDSTTEETLIPEKIDRTSPQPSGSGQVHSESAPSPKKEKPQLTNLAGSPSRSPIIQICSRPDQVDDDEDDLVNPIFCGTVFVKQGDRDLTLAEVKRLPNQKERAKWSKKYLLLRNRKLYYADDHENMLKFYYMDDQQFKETLDKIGQSKKEKNLLELIGPMSDYEVYTGIKARRHHNAPHGGGIYLRRHDGNLKKPIKLMFCPKPKPDLENDFGPDISSKGKKLWVAAMRVAKHGKKLKEDYQTYKSDFQEYKVKLQVLKDPRVPMDFTEGVGRIVHDQAEIDQIRREPKQTHRIDRFEKYEAFPKEALDHGGHLTQKYYHGELGRPEAEKLLMETYTNGAWLLRDSNVRTNCLTISYLYQGRVHHKYVSAASYYDESTRARIYVATLDQQLAFYDVHTLTEFYRLNKGNTMMCMLSTSVKKESQRDSSPPRVASPKSSNVSRPVPINLRAALARVPSNRSPQSIDNSKSPRSFKDFFSKSIKKSKQALKPKKLSLEAPPPSDPALPSTSKEADSGAVVLKQEEPSLALESPPSTSQEPSSSGISLSGGQTTPDSPPSSSRDEPQSSDPVTTLKSPLA